MNQNFGREMPPPHVQQVHRHAARYLVVIPGPDGPIARFFGANREPLAELDANTEEVTTMLKGLTPAMGAGDMDWSSKLSGHSPQERASALIYTLDV